MPIQRHPGKGVVMTCDYGDAFIEPEMKKRRLVIALCPGISVRHRLCTVIPLSTTPPTPVMQYHAEVDLGIDLGPKWPQKMRWIKGDMVNAVCFDRLDLIRLGKDRWGNRVYQTTPVSDEIIGIAQKCLLSSLGLAKLTKHI
jgi:uncharacterized protein YifN (PemK superfamily)